MTPDSAGGCPIALARAIRDLQEVPTTKTDGFWLEMADV